MNSEARKLLRSLEWNKRAWTFDEVEIVCDSCAIELDYAPMRIPGLFWMPDGVPSIVLSEGLRGIQKLEVALHELGHFFTDTPAAALYSPESTLKREYQANKFAIIAMIPLPLLKRAVTQYNLWDLADEYGYTAERFQFRWEIYQRCRI